MIPEQEISIRLERYLDRLSDLRQKWQVWLDEYLSWTNLAQNVTNESPRLLELQGIGEHLVAQLVEMQEARTEILYQCRATGIPGNSLREVSKRLSTLSGIDFQASLELARQHLAQLRRLHVATWIALKESAVYCQDSLTILMSGSSATRVTIDQQPLESGGQLLDATL